jgi:hypothetical protein
VTLAPLLFGGAVMITGWVAGAAGLTIHPASVLILSTLLAAGIWWVGRRPVGRRESFDGVRLVGFVVVVVGFMGYFCWLAWPSLLPTSEGPDLVHHLSLIHFIQQRHALPDSATFGAYLGEMTGYTPGSHLLAASVAEWIGADGLRVLYPLTAATVALKSGILYNLLLRLFPGGRANAVSALAGTLLLLVPHAYLLRSFTAFYFYAQVIAETFAIAMLWVLVVWFQQPSRWLLVWFSIFGIAVVLCWPVLLPAPAVAFAIVVLWRGSGTLRDRLRDLSVALAPIAAVALVYTATHTKSAVILSSGGSTVVPAVSLFGWPFLALVAAGAILAVRRADTVAPVLAFVAACLAQIAALVALQLYLRSSNLYLASKSVHLLTCGLVLLAGIAIESGWHTLVRVIRASWHRRVAWALPMLVALAIARTDIPIRPVRSPLTEPVYRAGLWAKANLPSACVDYLVSHWVTAYWLHVDLLGNPRQSERMRTDPFDYPVTVGRWIVPGSLPFAVVEDLDSLPADARLNVRVVQSFGRAAVVERADGGGVCHDDTLPIDRLHAGAK